MTHGMNNIGLMAGERMTLRISIMDAPGVVYMRYDGEPWKAPNMNDINMALLSETSTFGA